MFESKYHKLFLAAFCIANLTWSSIALPTNLTKAATAPKSVPQSQGPPDPCEQALTPPGNANGLHKRCDAAGIGGGTAKGDFNGDGFADLAIGVPFEDQNGVNAVGGVRIAEPAADLAVCLAVVSSLSEKAIPGKVAVFDRIDRDRRSVSRRSGLRLFIRFKRPFRLGIGFGRFQWRYIFGPGDWDAGLGRYTRL